MRACRNAGIKVSQETIDRAINYMKRLATTDGGFSYQYGMNQSNPARTGAGVLSLYLAGMRDSQECQAGWIIWSSIRSTGNDWIYRDHFHYSIYYVTQAMYQAGGDYWKTWYPGVRDRLVASQDTDGSWATQRLPLRKPARNTRRRWPSSSCKCLPACCPSTRNE